MWQRFGARGVGGVIGVGRYGRQQRGHRFCVWAGTSDPAPGRALYCRKCKGFRRMLNHVAKVSGAWCRWCRWCRSIAWYGRQATQPSFSACGRERPGPPAPRRDLCIARNTGFQAHAQPCGKGFRRVVSVVSVVTVALAGGKQHSHLLLCCCIRTFVIISPMVHQQKKRKKRLLQASPQIHRQDAASSAAICARTHSSAALKACRWVMAVSVRWRQSRISLPKKGKPTLP